MLTDVTFQMLLKTLKKNSLICRFEKITTCLLPASVHSTFPNVLC